MVLDDSGAICARCSPLVATGSSLCFAFPCQTHDADGVGEFLDCSDRGNVPPAWIINPSLKRYLGNDNTGGELAKHSLPPPGLLMLDEPLAAIHLGLNSVDHVLHGNFRIGYFAGEILLPQWLADLELRQTEQVVVDSPCLVELTANQANKW